MLFTIIGYDVENSLERRLAARPAHLARLEILQDQGRLNLAGPFPIVSGDAAPQGFLGSLIVADFESLAAARAWADADPYMVSGVYAKVDIFAFKKVFPSQ
ncbi:MAG: YciI family protein [Rhodocyclaceae bacterium]|nr:YciI family protein [Rhodocyclaceae bacterium]MBL0076059.1 YciI family protein [Rhodocyclaceae bacterium]MBP6108362.1 YciI family protein [Rhodocyclaceae bacterium]MBP6278378.1 YciI family protein [Rhodocyclaceae bacterium]